MSKSSNLARFLFFFVTIFIIVHLSPKLFSPLQPDSSSYLSFQPYRTSIYPYFIILIEKLNLNVFLIQKLILSLSLSYFFLSFFKNNILFFLTFSFTVFNFFYTTFSNTLLTESLFFSLLNISFAIIIFKKKDYVSLIILGLSLGFLITLRPIGITIALPVFIYTFFFDSSIQKKKIFLFTISLVSIIILENKLFFKNHDLRKSVFSNSVLGKLIMLSPKNAFITENYSNELEILVKDSKKKFLSVDNYLNKIDNIFLKSELSSDYEVVAQYQYLDENFDYDEKKKLKKKFDENYKSYYFEIIKNNFPEYLNASILNYFGMWSVGNKIIYFNKKDENDEEVPLKYLLKISSGEVDYFDIRILILISYSFILLFFMTHIISLIYLYKLKSSSPSILLIVFIIHFYLICVAFSNIATIRYLMPIFPLILYLNYHYLSSIFFLKKRY